MKHLVRAFLFALTLTVTVSGQQGMGPGPGLGKPPGAGGGSGDFASDTFTNGSDQNLQAHTGDSPFNITWSLHPSYSGTTLVNSSLGRIYLNTSAAAAYFISAAPSSATYCVRA